MLAALSEIASGEHFTPENLNKSYLNGMHFEQRISAARHTDISLIRLLPTVADTFNALTGQTGLLNNVRLERSSGQNSRCVTAITIVPRN